jgi:hypothetical protein
MNMMKNRLLLGGVLGIGITTWVAPYVITTLFKAPVNFGANCAPAAAWSMQKLVICQGAGFVFGVIAGALAFRSLSKKKQISRSAVRV